MTTVFSKSILLGMWVAVALLCASCATEDEIDETTPPAEESPGNDTPYPELPYVIPFVDAETPYAGQAIRKIEFADNETSKVETIENLKGNSVFLVKVNKSMETVDVLDAGGILPTINNAETRSVRSIDEHFRGHSRFCSHFGTNNSFPLANLAQRSTRTVREFVAPQVGDERLFWVYDGSGEGGVAHGIQIQTTAHLKVVSEHCNIWVEDTWFDNSSNSNEDGKLTLNQINVLAEKFDKLYEYETTIFGYEQGGGLPENDQNYGGIDGDIKIQILVQDINYDFPSLEGITAGYVDYNDMDTQEKIDAGANYKTNLAEMFYLDALAIDSISDLAISILVHEFQHLIYSNEKRFQKGLDLDNADTWYNEILSMLASDLISPLIGITPENPNHPISYQIPYSLGLYRFGLYKMPWNDNKYSYETLYPFGAYLVRNFGGVDLLLEMVNNNYTGYESISAALNKLNPGMDFDKALSRYGEALIYSGNHIPDGAVSFDKTVSQNINGNDYTFYGFDIWETENYYTSNEILAGYKGPDINNPHFFYDAWEWRNNMFSHSPAVQSLDEWQKVSGSLEIELQKPNSPDIEMYLMVR
jgi:hypothetical protein